MVEYLQMSWSSAVSKEIIFKLITKLANILMQMQKWYNKYIKESNINIIDKAII